MAKPDNIVQIDIDAEYAAARADAQRAKTERDKAKAEVETLQRQIYEASEKSPDGASDAHALAFLDGKPAPETPQTTRLRLDEARGRLAVIERAVTIAGERAKAARKKLDRRIIAAARPRHAEAVKRIAAGLVELARAIEAEERLRFSLPGGALSLPPMQFPNVGWLGAHDSAVNFWLRRAKSLGFLPRDFKALPDAAALAAE